eukprot:gene10907-12121_t
MTEKRGERSDEGSFHELSDENTVENLEDHPKKKQRNEQEMTANSALPSTENTVDNYRIISVILRGDITERIYGIWKNRLPECFPNYHITLSTKFLPGLDYLVADSTVTKEALVSWMGSDIPSLSPTVKIVFPSYIVHLLKTGIMKQPEEEHIHHLQYCVLFPSLLHLPQAQKDQSNPTTQVSNRAKHKPPQPKKMEYKRKQQGKQLMNANKFLTDPLHELQKLYKLCNDQWREQAYRHCISVLKQMPRISDASQIESIKGIGASLRAKINELLTTGKLTKLQSLHEDPSIKPLLELTSIWGIGARKAAQLIKDGIKTIADLREKAQHTLTAQQLIGLKYHEELKQPIPRQEVETISQIVREHCDRLLAHAQCVVCGSFRREKSETGDIDILVAPSDDASGDRLPPRSLHFLVASLMVSGLITDQLAISTEEVLHTGRASFMGICMLGGENRTQRRLDLKIYSRSELAFATLYFTGSGPFNRAMRLYAKRRGFLLNDHELVYHTSTSGFGKEFPYYEGQRFSCHSEEEIFNILKIPFVPPEDREIFDAEQWGGPDDQLEIAREEMKAMPSSVLTDQTKSDTEVL